MGLLMHGRLPNFNAVVVTGGREEAASWVLVNVSNCAVVPFVADADAMITTKKRRYSQVNQEMKDQMYMFSCGNKNMKTKT